MQSTYKGTHSMSQQQQHTENKHGFMVSCTRLRTWRTLCVIRHIALFLVSPLLVCYKMSEKFTLISLWIKPTDSLNSSFIGITTLHVSDSLSAYHQEFLAVHQLWYILCSCDDRLLPGVGWNCSLNTVFMDTACWVTSRDRSETPWKFWNVMLEKDGEDQLDTSCEK